MSNATLNSDHDSSSRSRRRHLGRFAAPALVAGLLATACGSSPPGTTTPGTTTPGPVTPRRDEPVVSTLSGTGVYNFANGSGASAAFRNPYGVAVDTAGNVYVADQSDHRIRKVAPDGTTTTLAGAGVEGFANGAGTAARFDYPNGVEVDEAGNVYVADSGNKRIRKITPGGVVTTFAGTGQIGSDNGPASSASFQGPSDIAIDDDGTLYVADTNQVRRITTAGVVSTLAGSGVAGASNGAGTTASFDSLRGIDVDKNHNVYVADSFNNKVRKITPAGVVSTFAGSGAFSSIDGLGSAATFSFPLGLAVDRFGNVFVGDSFSQKVRRITPSGTVSSYAGSGSTGAVDGPAGTATFNYLLGVAVDDNDTVYVGDNENRRIRKITRPAQSAPVVSSGPPASGPAGTDVALFGSVSDADNWPLPLTVVWNVRLIGPAGNVSSCSFTNRTTLTPTLNCTVPGRYVVQIHGSDGPNGDDDTGAAVTFT